jgi:hypothetical protein
MPHAYIRVRQAISELINTKKNQNFGRIHAYAHKCVHVYMHICVRVSFTMCVYVCLCLHAFVIKCMHTYTHMHLRTYVCTCARMYVCTKSSIPRIIHVTKQNKPKKTQKLQNRKT